MIRIASRLALLFAVLVGPAFLSGCASEESPAPAPTPAAGTPAPEGSAPGAPGAPAVPGKEAAK